MATVREVLYQHTKKISVRAIAKSFSMSKTTVSKYIELAKTYGARRSAHKLVAESAT